MITLDALYVAPPQLTAHAPVLTLVGPLIGACAVVLSPNARWGWMITVGASIFAGWMALAAAGEVARRGVVDYVIGGFSPPLGLAFHLDGLNAMMALLITFIGVMAALYSGHALNSEIPKPRHNLFLAGFLLCEAGLLGVVSTGDAFNAFVFLEVSSVATYALVAMGSGRDRRALPAAFNYLIMGSIGAAFFLTGIGFLYAATGSLNMADIAARLATLGDLTVVRTGFAFIIVGLGVKAAIFPLHGWLPNAYAFAPSQISVFLSATATKAAVYLMARFIFLVFRPEDGFVHAVLSYVLAPLAAMAAIVASIQAMFETDMRRILAFSSVAQVGYIILGLSMAQLGPVSAGLAYLLAHALAKAALFMGLGGVAISLRARTLAEFAGVGRDAPWTMSAFAVAALSLIGAPFTFGFLAKWRLIEAALTAGEFWIVGVIAVSSLFSVVYAGRMLEAVFFKAPAPGAPRAVEAPVGVLAPLLILAGLSVLFGFEASLPEGLADAGAQAVLGARP